MPVLFISRGSMSGVHQVVSCLHEHTGIRCVSRENLTEKINRRGEIATRVLEHIGEAVSDYDRFTRLRWPYLVLMKQALLEEILADNMVYHGYSSHLLLPVLQNFIRVRVDAPVQLRVRMTMERLLCDEAAARSYISSADEERVGWGRLVFCRDIRDPGLYDLHLNLGHMSLKAVCGILERTLLEEEFQTRPGTRIEVEKLLLAASVEAALVDDPRTHAFEISAKVEDGAGAIALYGPYLDDEAVATVTEVAGRASGVGKASYNPGYAPSLDTLDVLP
jgi:cytidylate kinase